MGRIFYAMTEGDGGNIRLSTGQRQIVKKRIQSIVSQYQNTHILLGGILSVINKYEAIFLFQLRH